MNLAERIEAAIGERPARLSPLAGGCVGDVHRADLADGRSIVVKSGAANLDVEAHMLRALARRSVLPVPEVLHDEPTLLIMEHIENDGTISSKPSEQRHGGELFAALHAVGPEHSDDGLFGFERDTLIGGLRQPNAWADSWIGFFAERRLVFMAHEARRAGHAPDDFVLRVERFARDRAPTLLDEPASPSLLHGDAWGGNILVRDGRVAGCIDPALYFGHAEVELAFGTLFGTFGDGFFEAYRGTRPIAEGFFEVRRDIYNLYPLLVHARLFGGGYLAQADAVLRRFGA